MDAAPFIAAARELRERFVSLVDTLSAVTTLVRQPQHHQDDVAIYTHALRTLMQYEDMERCSAFRLQDDRLTCVAGRDLTELVEEDTAGTAPRTRYAPRSFRLGEGIVGMTALSREMMSCPDCATDPRFSPPMGPVRKLRGAILCAPVTSGDELLGVLNVFHPEPHFFKDWHQHTLSTFAGILAHMLVSNRAIYQLEDVVARRTQQLEMALAEAQRLKRRYEELSTVDELTGLHNRRFFFAEAEAALARAVRYRDPFSLMILDVDFFKRINDTFGHAAGDSVLRDLAGILKEHTREGDILARFGGEEFVLAVPNTDLAGARTLADRIRQHVRSLEWKAEGNSFHLTVSAGIAGLEPSDKTPSRPGLDEVLRQADKALYYCKFSGRDQVCAYPDVPVVGLNGNL
jgi:diguanylate cyclase (GGDEF)-like protein